MISANTLSYAIGKKQLVNDINFDLQAGEILAIIGANGAGKSTLLKLLCREIYPSTGSIFFNGKNLNRYKLAELAKMRAVLTQHHTLSMSFKVKELVLMGRYPYFEQQPSEMDYSIMDIVMQKTGVSAFADREYNSLSGGEQQRVQLARVLAQIHDTEHAILFLDEPTNGLDILYQQQILSLAKDMANEGYGVICVLHDINFASRYADKILMLKAGEKIAYGTPKEVINCENIHKAFNINVMLIECAGYTCPLIMPEPYPVEEMANLNNQLTIHSL